MQGQVASSLSTGSWLLVRNYIGVIMPRCHHATVSSCHGVIMPRAKPTKKRKFYGNKYTRPLKETAKPCASEEKLQYTKKRSVVAELDGYRLIDVRNLVNFVSAFPCPNCGGHGYTVTEDIAGLRSSLSFECMNHDCGHTYKLSA